LIVDTKDGDSFTNNISGFVIILGFMTLLNNFNILQLIRHGWEIKYRIIP